MRITSILKCIAIPVLLAVQSIAAAQTSIGERSGQLEWQGWVLDYDTFEYADGLILKEVSYNGQQILARASFPIMSVYYEGNCGPYADRLNGPQQPVSWANDERLVAREFTQNGVRWFELGIRELIGSYDIYQVWYFSENGELDGQAFSRGIQCNYDHVHYPMWRFDFELDGRANDRIVREVSNGVFETMANEFEENATTAYRHGWYVEDTVTGNRVSIGFDSGAWNVGGNVAPEIAYENNLVGGALYNDSEIGWQGGASRNFPFINGESINNADVTMWYRGYLPHTPTEGSALWHSTGVRITVIDSDADFDGDGIPNIVDTDDDNDGVLDVNDDLPFDANESVDTDNDGIGNNADTDDDNDTYLDNQDLFPLDATEWADNDSDGIGNNADDDADNDGISDSAEIAYAQFSLQAGPFTIPENGGTATEVVSLAGNPVSIGQLVTITRVVADGDLNSLSESFTLRFNEDEFNTGEMQTGVQCSGSLAAVFGSISQTVTVVDIGNNTPGIRVTGQTSGAVDDILTCTGVEYRFNVSGENTLLDSDADQVANIYDLDSDNDAIADVIEGGLSDTDGDFRIDSLSQQASVTDPIDSDGDGLPDFVDIDSNGSTFDIATTQFTDLDTNNDGRLDGADQNGGIDDNANGVDDLIEAGVPPPPPPPPPPQGGLSTISYPIAGDVLSGNATFYFSAGTAPFDEWRMTMGVGSNGEGLFDSDTLNINTDPWEQTFGPLPSNGEQLTLRFWQRLTGGEWATFDTLYVTEGSGGEPPRPEDLSTISYPFAGDVLNGDVAFYLSPGVAPFEEWRMTMGTGSNGEGLFAGETLNINTDPWVQTFGPMPTNGEQLTLRIWQRPVGGEWATVDIGFVAENSAPPPPPPPEDLSTISYPFAGDVLSGDATFYFSAGAASFDEWRMTMGVGTNGEGLFESQVLNINTDPWEQTFGPMPDNGEQLTLRFWQRRTGGEWATVDTVYVAGNTGEPPPPPPPADLSVISYPIAGDVLSGDVEFYFSAGTAPFDEWRMTMGTGTNGEGLFDSQPLSINTDPWVQTFGPMPTNGEQLTLRFWQRRTGGQWATFDTVYIAEDNGGEPPPPPPQVQGLATFSYPTVNDVLSADPITFYFSPGTADFDEWRITIGTGPDATGVYDSDVRNLFVDPWEENVGSLPQSGPLYVRWWQRNNGGAWATFDSIYETSNSAL